MKSNSPLNHGLSSYSHWALQQAKGVLPTREDVRASLILLVKIIAGAILLYPLFIKLPILGWDWYSFFNGNNPVDNINLPSSPFLPYTKYFISLLLWMNWRDSLAILGGITYMAIALGTWKNNGKYGSILLALTTPIPLFVLWVGHPDGLALVGILIGWIPMALVHPQITFWSFLRSKAWIFWLAITMGFVLVLDPSWFKILFSGQKWDHVASFGWHALGWPVLILGLILIAGAGKKPWLLMAGGCLISPDLMPYHLVVLLPAIGCVANMKKHWVWLAAWLLVIGLGMGGSWRWINLVFPLSVYFSLQSWQNYKDSINGHFMLLRDLYHSAQRWLQPSRTDKGAEPLADADALGSAQARTGPEGPPAG